MSMIESGKQVVIAVVTSAVIGLGGQLLTLGSQRDLLNETRDATKILSQAVTELRIQVAEDRGKYVTRDELKAELKEVRRGS
jgi:hypothetical protein